MTERITEIHVVEKYTHPIYGRIFDGYLVGSTNVFPTLTQKCAMTSSQAIAWCCEVEKVAFQFSQAKKLHMDGTPSSDTLKTVRVYDNFQ